MSAASETKLTDRLGRPMKHGLTKTPEHSAWLSMRGRCHNPRDARYARYGGRGITICERWDSFLAFLEDMGTKPSPKHSIERKDNNGNYEPGNCVWATSKEQNNNKCSNVFITHDGVTLTVKQWADRIGAHYKSLLLRLKRGWDAEEALTTPFSKHRFRCSPGVRSKSSVPPHPGYKPPAGVTWEPKPGHWRVVVRGKYIGVFNTCEEAETAAQAARRAK